jgi:hypothetical protein
MSTLPRITWQVCAKGTAATNGSAFSYTFYVGAVTRDEAFEEAECYLKDLNREADTVSILAEPDRKPVPATWKKYGQQALPELPVQQEPALFFDLAYFTPYTDTTEMEVAK